jgi:hypothetical protein
MGTAGSAAAVGAGQRVTGRERVSARLQPSLLGCRAATGLAFKPFAGIERDELELQAGPDALVVIGDDDLNDTRYPSCGLLLFSVVRGGAYVHVALRSLSDAVDPAGRAHPGRFKRLLSTLTSTADDQPGPAAWSS